MILFISDLHLGRGSREDSLRAERDAVALLEAHREAMQPPGRLILLGDVFDAFLEYGTMVPSGFVRLQGMLAALVDEGVAVHYLVGNRDLWHVRHFEREVGVDLLPGPLTFEAFGLHVFAAHGDEYAPPDRFHNRLRPVLRHPLAYWLYRNLLPGDSAHRLAVWFSRLGRGEPDQHSVDALRDEARRILASRPVDLVVMGHSHHAELSEMPGGNYVNCGYWFADRTYGVLDEEGPRLLTWESRP